MGMAAPEGAAATGAGFGPMSLLAQTATRSVEEDAA
ncbi:hypothetical protein N826_06700 [Skermanella aerolata KACC 11604]|nr:hypothetical protein N826_06700 [Skermanella aerolata KACC 11604]